MAERIDALNAFVAGASAGLMGVGKADFKKDFSLGENLLTTGFFTLISFARSYLLRRFFNGKRLIVLEKKVD